MVYRYEFAVDTLDEARKVFSQLDLLGMISFEMELESGCEPAVTVRLSSELQVGARLRELVLALPRGVALVDHIQQFKR